MQISVEFLQEQKRNLEAERARAASFIANADGGLAVIEVMLAKLAAPEETVQE